MTPGALFCSGNADGLLIWRLCGSSKPRMPLVIPYPEVWIHFVTNERVEHVGFHAQYSFTGKTDDKLSNSSAKTIHKFVNDIFQKDLTCILLDLFLGLFVGFIGNVNQTFLFILSTQFFFFRQLKIMFYLASQLNRKLARIYKAWTTDLTWHLQNTSSNNSGIHALFKGTCNFLQGRQYSQFL